MTPWLVHGLDRRSHRIGIKQRGLILRPDPDGELAWSWARWSLVPPGKELTLPRSTTPASTSSLAVESVPDETVPGASVRLLGAREEGAREGQRALVVLRTEVGGAVLHGPAMVGRADPKTGDPLESYTVLIGDANGAMRVHNRMPVMLQARAARTWIEPGPLPFELLQPYPADEMTAWRVIDNAKNSRITPRPAMAAPVEEATGGRPGLV